MHFATTALIAVLTAAATSASPILGWKHDIGNWKNDVQVFYFDKTYAVKATPSQVRNGTTAVPGQPGAKGHFEFGINVNDNTICYNITLSGVTGEYKSPALTATHIHEAPKGASGPPRLAFPNPQGPDEKRVSSGCLTGPFTTGVIVDGKDTGEGFHVSQIVANPAGFFCDTHTEKYTLGAVRGQLC